MKTAKINEIFYSLQGEGPYRGIPQVFIRFSGCNLGCIYCDTQHNTYRIFGVKSLLKEVLKIPSDIHSVSITGGEPLYQAGFLMEFFPVLKKSGYKIYLETNGILYNELEDLLPYIDIIAMDFKLPTSTGKRPFWREHEEFLKTALGKDVFVKAVITEQTLIEDWLRAVDIIHRIAPRVLLVLQPATSTINCKEPAEVKISAFKNLAKEILHKVEVIPQVHYILGLK